MNPRVHSSLNSRLPFWRGVTTITFSDLHALSGAECGADFDGHLV